MASPQAVRQSEKTTHRRRVSSVSGYALEATLRNPTANSGGTRNRRSTLSNGQSQDDLDFDTTQAMSLSRTPSPQLGGGWATAGLSPTHRSSSKPYNLDNDGAGVTWSSAKARTDKVNKGAAMPAGIGFLKRHMRKISSSLPLFYPPPGDERYSAKGKRKEWHSPRLGDVGSFANRMARLAWRMRLRLVVTIISIVAIILLYLSRTLFTQASSGSYSQATALAYHYRRTGWLGGGSKFVIILAANQGGGVMEWKGPREWAIERDSVRNKKKYVARWGYELEIVDMSTKKRYAHEWRESWEKVDTIRNAMRKYPHAEWCAQSLFSTCYSI